MERRLKCGVCAAAALALVLCFGMEQKTRAMQTAGNAQTTLVIDAGHGGFDGGAMKMHSIMTLPARCERTKSQISRHGKSW